VRREADQPRNVSEYLGADHDRLDALLQQSAGLAERGVFEEAAQTFAEFRTGLGRHIDAEEGILFPAFEELTGMEGGPVSVMRREHVVIRGLLAETAVAIKSADAAATARTLGWLRNALEVHNLKEEQMLYPMTDAAAGDEQVRDRLVSRLQAIA
jgi:iron-sulfur cluster repair protein YtfE (RIC family)